MRNRILGVVCSIGVMSCHSAYAATKFEVTAETFAKGQLSELNVLNGFGCIDNTTVNFVENPGKNERLLAVEQSLVSSLTGPHWFTFNFVNSIFTFLDLRATPDQ